MASCRGVPFAGVATAAAFGLADGFLSARDYRGDTLHLPMNDDGDAWLRVGAIGAGGAGTMLQCPPRAVWRALLVAGVTLGARDAATDYLIERGSATEIAKYL